MARQRHPRAFSYYGSKWRDSHLYSAPICKTIVEPFAGSAGYSSLYFRKKVILVERDPVIASVWKFVIGASKDDIMDLPLLDAGESVKSLGLPIGPQSLIGFWVNHAASTPCNTLSAWGTDGKHVVSFWGKQCRARLANSIHKFDHWEIIEGDYTIAPDIRATWFVDPPYQEMGVHYKFGCDSIDYKKLGEWCRQRQGQVIVCENEPAQWLPFKKMFVQKGASQRKRFEVVWEGW